MNFLNGNKCVINIFDCIGLEFHYVVVIVSYYSVINILKILV